MESFRAVNASFVLWRGHFSFRMDCNCIRTLGRGGWWWWFDARSLGRLRKMLVVYGSMGLGQTIYSARFCVEKKNNYTQKFTHTISFLDFLTVAKWDFRGFSDIYIGFIFSVLVYKRRMDADGMGQKILKRRLENEMRLESKEKGARIAFTTLRSRRHLYVRVWMNVLLPVKWFTNIYIYNQINLK